MAYKRILLKLSGEIFGGSQESGVDGRVLADFAKRLKVLQKKKYQIGIVVGGGNIWRFRDFKSLKFDRVASDTMGMLATVINAMALKEALKSVGAKVKAMSNLSCAKAAEDYKAEIADEYLNDGNIVIFAGGTGNPFFTTDSAAALKALELKCDVLLKATKVDYVYDKDPEKFKNARKFEKMNYQQVIEKGLGVMDLTCAALCKEGKMKMIVFNMEKSGNLEKAIGGKKIGTIIS